MAYAGPRGEVGLRDDQTVTVLFNRGMRALENPEDQGLPSLVVRTAEGKAIPGRARWVGTRGLLFVPDSSLPGGNRVVVTVPAAVQSLDGSTLGADYTFEFTTPSLGVLSAQPDPHVGVLDQKAPIVLAFNESVSFEALKAATHLVAKHADGEAPQALPFHITDGGGSVKSVHLIAFQADAPLPYDSQIELTVDAGLRGIDGPAPMEKPYTYRGRSLGPLRLESFFCTRQSSEGRCRAHYDVAVRFTNPVDPAEFRSHLKVKNLLAKPDPKKPQRKPRTDREQWLGADPQLGKRYTVTIAAGLRDIYGQTLPKDSNFDIDVELPYEGIALAAKNAGNKKNNAKPAPKPAPKPVHQPKPVAHAPVPDPRPHRPRQSYDLQVGVAGRLVEALATTGTKSHKVPVGSVNIATYELAEAPLSEAQLLASFASGDFRAFSLQNHITPALITPGAPDNTRFVRTVDLDTILGKSGRGVAVVAVDVPGETPRWQRLSVTDLGISAKASRMGSLVWVTSLASGKPVPGAAVSIRTVADGELFATKTNAEGLAEVPGEKFDPMGDKKGVAKNAGPAFVFVRSGDDWTYESMQRSGTDQRVAGSFQDFSGRPDVLGMVYTERGIYRPGETAKFAGIFRIQSDSGLKPVAGEEVRIEANDAYGSTVFTNRVKLDAFGAFATDVVIPKTAHVGESRLVATLQWKGHTTDVSKYVYFSDYKPSEFKVDVVPDAKAHIRGDELSYSVRAEYLFGGPMAGATAHTTVTRQAAPFTPPGVEDCATTDEAAKEQADAAPRTEDMESQNATLDANGSTSHKLKLAMPGQTVTERVMIETEVEDLSHQTVNNRGTLVVHPAEFYLALKHPKERFVAAGGPLHVEVAAVDPDGGRRVGAPVKIELFERKWVAAVEEQGGTTAHRSSKMVDEPVGACDVKTDVAFRGCDLKVPEAGYFVLAATARDSRGNDVKVSETMYGIQATPTSTNPIAWGESDTRTVKLDGNKSTYDIGETARFLVRNPFREAEALVTVERHGVLYREVKHLTGPMPTLDIPITKDMYPNAFVSVHIVRGRISAPPESGIDLGGPEFRLGYGELKVNADAHRLNVTVKPAKTEYKPGDEVDVDVAVADRQGQPVESELAFFAVDEGALMLTGFQTPDPLPSFVKRRSLSVFTVEARESLAHILPIVAGERVAILGFDYLSPGDKGYPGGGGAAGAKRGEFRSTAYFEAGKITDKEGKAHIHFKLPDNLTTFRLMTVAANASDYFGSGDAKITASKKLMARTALPRFIRVGDTFDASVVVSSKELVDADVDVTLSARGLTLAGDASKRVKIPKTGNVEVRFPVTAKAPGEAEIEFALRSGAEADTVQVKRKVSLPLHKETLAAYGSTQKAAAIALGDMSSMETGSSEVRLKMAPSALVGISTSFENLLDYPYGCTEQLTSRTLPLVALADLAKEFGVKLPSNVPKVVEEAVEEILKNQRGDGGFGFWGDSDRSEPWLSAYVAITLDAAKRANYKVSSSGLESLTSYLRSAVYSRLPDSDSANDEGETQDAGLPPEPATHRRELLPDEKSRLDYANAAFLLDALATIGASDTGYLTRLYDARRGKTIAARSLLLHALAVSKANPEPIATLAKEIERDLRVDAGSAVARLDGDDAGQLAIYETSARSTALALRGLLAAFPNHALAPRLATGLLELRENGAWNTTQENGWALIALRDYRTAQESSAKSFEGKAYLGSSLLGSTEFKSTSDAEVSFKASGKQLAESGGPLTFEVSGTGQLFYQAEIRYATAVLPKEAQDRGLFVKKLLRAVRSEDIRAATEWIPKQSDPSANVGDMVLTDLLLESSEARRQVVIDDPLPAGVEAVDIKLETASQSRTVSDDTESNESASDRDARARTHAAALQGIGAAFRTAQVHREVRDDRVLTFIENLPPGMYHFRYLARATAVGKFVVPPTRVEAMYSPEVWGSTPAMTYEVTAKP